MNQHKISRSDWFEACITFTDSLFEMEKLARNSQFIISSQGVVCEEFNQFLAWWEGFNDPTLNRLIERGLRCNTSLNMSRGSIEAAEGELKKIRYQWIPNADVMFGYSRNSATGFTGILGVIIPSYVINIVPRV